MRTRSITCLCLAAATLCTSAVHAADFTAWGRNQTIRFSGYSRTEALSNFPVLVVLSTNINGFSYGDFLSGTNGDLRFAASDGTNELNYEVESWDTNGASYVWVQVPSIADSNTFIRAYWGMAGQTNQAYTTNGAVWSAGYAGVWHMNQSSGPVLDSTANRFHGVGTSIALTNGVVGRGLYFNGSSTSILLTNTFSVTGGKFTVELWGWTTNTTPGMRLFDSQTGRLLCRWNQTATSKATYFDTGDHPTLGCGTNLNNGTWQQTVYALDQSANTASVYQAGALVGSGTFGTTTLGGSNRFGSTYTGTAVLFQGSLDEFRVSSVVRSSNWVWATYMDLAANASFMSYGQVRALPVVDNAIGATNITSTSATLTGTLLSSGSDPAAVFVYWGTTDGTNNAGAWANTNVWTAPCATGALSYVASSLSSNQLYYYRFAATNAGGINWATTSVAFITGAMSIQAPDPVASETGSDTGTFSVYRPAWATGVPLRVSYTITGTASNGVDYVSLTGSVTIAAGATNALITVTPLADLLFEPSETVTLTLTDGPYVIGGANSATVTIASPQTTDWSRKASISFAGYGRDETLTNFPALVVLSTNIPGFRYTEVVSAGGADLRFSDASQTTELSYEIEKWDTNGNSYVWVRVPYLSGSNTTIWAYWGRSGSSAPTYTTNGTTWSEGYAGVWHLDETGGTSFDSTGNGNNGASSNATLGVAGQIGLAASFDGSNDWIQVPDAPSLCAMTNLTIEAWARDQCDDENPRGLVSKRLGSTTAVDYFLYKGTNSTLWFFVDKGCGGEVTNTYTGSNVWRHLVATFDPALGADEEKIYIDGSFAGATTNNQPAVSNATSPLCIGILNPAYGYSWFGQMDEVRISRVTRSTNWIWACWMNQASNGIFGSIQVASPAIANTGAGVINVGSVALNGTLSSTGQAATAVTVYWGTNDGGTVAGIWNTNVTFSGAQNPGPVSTTVGGLAPNTLYWYRYFATNAFGGSWAGASSPFIVGDVTLQATDPTAAENGLDPAEFMVFRPAASTGSAMTVYYMVGGTASNGVDYGNLPGAVTIPAGATNASIVVSPLWDWQMEPVETVILTLGVGGYTIGSANTATATIADATTWFVATNGVDTNGGTSWGAAFRTISNGVAHAAAGQTVMVSNGTYNVGVAITITNAIQVRGTNGPTVTIVQRSGGTYFRVFDVTNDVASATLSGLTIRNGYIKEDRGGGAGVQMAAGTITNCIIRDNVARRSTGGAVSTHGGGVKMAGGLVVDCSIVSNDSADYWGGRGGGVYMTGGTVLRCVITNNTADTGVGADGGASGGGVYLEGAGSVLNCTITANHGHYGSGVNLAAGGLVRNCLIANSPDAGGVYMTGGVVENCTVAGNAGAVGDTYSGLRMTSGSVVRNTIVWGNQAGYASVTKGSGTSFDYSIAGEAIAGISNLTDDPRFLLASAGNYHLGEGSPAMNSGTNLPWVVSASDLDGHARLINGTVDRGAYETDPSAGPLQVYWEGTDPLVGTDSLSVEFKAYPSGGNTTATYYWNFGDGHTQSGPGLSVVTNTFGAGLYTVTLAATNSVNEGAGSTRSNYVRVLTTAMTYVCPSNSTPTLPYTNWATAAQSIQAAIDAAATAVLVTDGTYNVTAEITIGKGITLRSVNGPGVTTIQRGSGTIRILELGAADSNAAVSGFTIRNGKTPLEAGDTGGAGILMAAGTVTNCTIRDNHGNRNTGNMNYGGGIQMSGGLVVDSRVTDNLTDAYWSGQGGGVYMTGGMLLRCVLTNNTAIGYSEQSGSQRGGGLYLIGGIAQNCVIAYNDAHYGGGAYIEGGRMRGCLLHHSAEGGGAFMSGGTVENCTIADNLYGDRAYGGLGMSGGGVTNTIVYWNQAGQPAVSKTGGEFHSSVSDTVIAGSNNLTADPSFKDLATLDYSLAPASLCRDSGTNLDWMTGSLDLAGNTRVLSGVVDRGAYEFDAAGSPLSADFSADQRVGTNLLVAVFTASVSGPTNGVVYYWNLGNGNTPSGADKGVVTNTYTTGLYDVSLTVTNDAGTGVTRTVPGFIRVRTTDSVYCATNGSQVLPYTNWVTAATNLQDAIDMAQVLVRVASGTYGVDSQVTVDRGVTVRSENGAKVTRLASVGTGMRVMTVSHSNAVVDGLTIMGGDLGPGAGLWLVNGTVQNCTISNNSANAAAGGGAYVSGGVLQNCLVARNYANLGSGQHEGGGVYLSGTGKLRNCLIYGNYGQNRGGGVDVAGSSTEVDACTIVGNKGGYMGGGIYFASAGTVRNSIIVANTAGAGGGDDLTAIGSVTYSCSPTLTSGAGNVTNDPQFVASGSGSGLNAVPGDYRLWSSSRCVNAGTNQTWMIGAFQLGGGPRIVNGRVDMGVYEQPAPGSTYTLR